MNTVKTLHHDFKIQLMQRQARWVRGSSCNNKENTPLAEKKELGELISRALEGKNTYDYRRKNYVQMKPIQGFLAAEHLHILCCNSLNSDIPSNLIGALYR